MIPTVTLDRVDPRLRLTCQVCGESYSRSQRCHGRPPRICPGCRQHHVPGDIPAREIERRYRRALQASRAAGRFRISSADCWRHCVMRPAIDRGPDTEVGVAFPEAW